MERSEECLAQIVKPLNCLRGFTTIDESDRSTPGKPLGDENWSEVILTPGKIDIASWKAGRTTITSEDIAFSPRNR